MMTRYLPLFFLCALNTQAMDTSPRKGIPLEFLTQLSHHLEPAFWLSIDTLDSNKLSQLLSSKTNISGLKRSYNLLSDTPLLAVIEKYRNPDTLERAQSMIILLLKHAADINECGKDGMPPLAKAILYEQVFLAELLIEHGADKNQTFNFNNHPMTPLELACHMKLEKKIAGLLEKN